MGRQKAAGVQASPCVAFALAALLAAAALAGCVGMGWSIILASARPVDACSHVSPPLRGTTVP
eukprot:15189478-Alexandrium_andersonii.AAC.1